MMIFGNRKVGMAMNYPDDCLQKIIDPENWWETTEGSSLERGSLIWAFAPHVEQTPVAFEPIGRSNPTEHGQAEVQVTQIKVNQPLKQVTLPVAALPKYDNEVWTAYRAKKRPMLVLGGVNCPTIEKELIKGKPKGHTSPVFVAAPFFGVDEGSGKRAGYSSAFVERVRHCEYPQFVWDQLPFKSGRTPKESILRLDQIRPIGNHHNSYSLTGFRMSEGALDIIDDLLSWVIWDGLDPDSILVDYRSQIENTYI